MEHKTHQNQFHLTTISILLILLTPKSTAQNPPRHTPQAYTNFIKTSCTKTTYPKLCLSSLSAHATAIQASPRLLANTALTVALATTRTTSSSLSQLARAHMTPRQAGAMRDCLEVLGDSVDELRQSVAQMAHLRGPGFAFHMSNVQTWVSAALTNDDTCTDGFDEKAMDGDVKAEVSDKIVKIAQLTSNALALINSYASSGPRN